jgi:hypothetical protein
MSVFVAWTADCPICQRVRDTDPFSPDRDAALEWHVHVSRHAETIEVYPTEGGMISVSWWQTMPGLLSLRERWGSFKLWYPKSDSDLQRGVAVCQRYCERQMERESEASLRVARAAAGGGGART